MRPTLLAVAAAVALSGCASPPRLYDYDNTFIAQASVDDTWEAVIDAFGAATWPVESMERASGYITTDWVGVFSDDLVDGMDCGSEALTLIREYGVKFNVIVREQSPSETELTVNTSMRALRTHLDGDNPRMVTCTSRGTVEAYVANEVFRQLGR